MMKVKIFGLMFCLALLVSGCNTMQGAGEDMEAAGEAMQDEAEEEKSY